MRSFLLALACLTLTGCWYGIGLFSASDSRPVIPAGDYLATAKDEPTRTMRVSILPDGLTQFDGGEKKETYGFSPLDPASGSYVMWLSVKNEDPKASDEPGEYQIYLLMVRVRAGEYRIYPPDCKDADSEVARANGATIDPGPSSSCHFTTRASLEAALRQLPHDESSAGTLKRIP